MSQEPVAIIGIACVFPQAPDLRAFWRNVLDSVDAIGEPVPEWEAARYLDSGRIATARGGWLGDLYRFDPRRFGVMPSSLDGGEPDQFLALQVAHEALADAGYAGPGHDHRDTGIVLGHSTYLHRGQGNLIQHQIVLDQTLELLDAVLPDVDPARRERLRATLEERLPQFNADVAPGLVPNVMTGRIANRLDLRGPNYLIDAACSSSLLAVGAALDELRSGRSRMMLAGGVNGSLPAEVAVIFTQLGALTKRGKVRPFGRGSDGTLLGEGLGVVVLKPLAAALEDGDRVYALVHAVGQASDGRGLGLLAPSVEGEVLAIRRAYSAAGIDPASVELIEAHGTGIALGDRTEIAALGQVLGERRGAQGSVAIGSVKSNISHCIPAAGIAGLIKTALALHHRVLPPTLCEEVEPGLGIERTPLYVNTARRAWIARGDGPRRAGVDSFGFGGINAHAILEEAPPRARRPGSLSRWPEELFVFSAPSGAELAARLAETRALLERRADLELDDLAAALARRDRGEAQRLALVARDRADLLAKLAQAAKRLEKGDARWSTRNGACFGREPLAGKLAFLFPGEGSQYLGMFADLALCFPEIGRWLAFWRGLYPDRPGESRTEILFPPASELTAERRAELEARLLEMDVGSEAVFVCAQGMHALLRSLGVRPDAMVGHSTGESSALAAAGAMPGDELARMAECVQRLNRIYRGLVEAGRIPTGALLTVGALSRAETEERVRALGGDVVLAMDNCKNEQVYFGDEGDVQALAQALAKAGAICKRLPFDRGYHTPRFAAVQAAFLEYYGEIGLGAPRVPVYSCATTGLFPDDAARARELAASQWSTTVRFRETLERMHSEGVRFFVEVGPSASLSAFVHDTLAGKEYLALATDKRQRGGIEPLLTVLAHLYVHRLPLDLGRLFESRAIREIDWSGAPPVPRGVRLANTMPVLRVDRGDAALGELRGPAAAPPAPARRAAAARADGTGLAPLLTRVLELDGRRCRARCELALDEQRFLRHHVLSGPVSAADPELCGLSCVPLTVSLEILAEACALLAGGAPLRSIRDVRAFDWVALDEGRVALEVVAEAAEPGAAAGAGRRAFRAEIRDGAKPILSAELVFGAAERAEPPAPLAPLRESRASRWADEELYATGMFHGPLFQSVARISAWGEEGIDAELSPVALDGFLVEGERPAFVLNPVLLDALGQLSAFWICEQIGTDFNSFPSAIERIELASPCPQDSAGLVARGRQRALGAGGAGHGARAWQFEVLGADGAPLVRVTDLVNVFFPVPHGFYRVRHEPLRGELGHPLEGLDGDPVLLWELAHLPEAFCLQSSGIFLRILAHAVLGRAELDEWRALADSPRRRRTWLQARVCLKEAVRHWVLRQTGMLLYPADIGVVHDERGAPSVGGWWTEELVPAPAVSLSHDRRQTVAAVSFSGHAVGIDVEALGAAVHTDLLEGALAPPEREALQRFPEDEWPERVMRIWCAKESAAKALGTGLQGRPDHFLVSFPHDQWHSALVQHSGEVVEVSLARDRDRIVALAAWSSS